MTHRGQRPRVNRGTFIQQSREKTPEQKALYHQVLGAGRGRVKRAFLGATDADLSALAAALQTRIQRRLRAAGG